MTDWKKPMKAIAVGKGRKLRDGKDIAILSIGPVGNLAIDACNNLSKQGIEAAHYDMRFAKPIDEMLLHEVFSKHDKVITVEDGCIIGGMGSAVVEFMSSNGYMAQVKRLGIPDQFIDHGEQKELYAECGFDAQGILNCAVELIAEKKNAMVG
jgi:1-deoxy-D-xylulose-5-phosphate synthase